jgi:hypothetical protein
VARTPVYVTMRDEIIGIVGAPVYELLAALLVKRSRRTVLPHPAVRR